MNKAKRRIPVPRRVSHETVDFYMSNLCSDFNCFMKKADLSYCIAEAVKDGKILFSEDTIWLLCQLYHELKPIHARNRAPRRGSFL